MGPLDAFWHLLNFIAPALGLGLISAAAVKLLWRRDLASVRWARLAAWGSTAALLALVGGLLIQGRDGRMSTYAAMVLACALAQWWAAFGPRQAVGRR
jgi:hypothetical protein